MKETQVKKTRFNIWAWHNLPPCKEIVKLITASLDGKLSVWKTFIMKLHLFTCPPCQNFLSQLKFLRCALPIHDEKIADENSSVKLSDEARERLKNKLKSARSVSEPPA